MTVLPALAFATAMVYWLSGAISQWFSQNVASVIDLLLFVVVFVSTHTFLRSLKGD